MIKYERLKEHYFYDKDLNVDYYFLSRTGRRLTTEAIENVFKQANDKTIIRETIRCSPHT
jgi:integrase/recombinase XerD